jgi:Pyruvate/2-oxoacid:ferredoxin oxidoreductase delta subunit
MGHLVGKDLYRKLGKKIDGLTMRAPWNDTLYGILKELYTADEAELVVKMPYGFSNLEKIAQVTKIEMGKLKKLLDNLSEKGLLIDAERGGQYWYIISPLVIGIFEFTMMRTRGELDYKEWARLFHEYFEDKKSFYHANFGHGEKITPLRALPYEDAVHEDAYVEILDFEKASEIIERSDKFGIGICSCRHEKLHAGEKKCDVPLETCSTFGNTNDYMIRHGFAKEVSRAEMHDNLNRSKEMGLVLCADNVQKDISFICHCCGCCCNVLLGISKFGYPGILLTSNFIARADKETCIDCGNCQEACPIDAITGNEDEGYTVDESICIGCGVCALNCDTESMKLVKREQRVIPPEDMFERVILQALERGNLQNLMFDNPQSVSHKFMRGFVGGFLKLPPVKKALMSDTLRSRFLNAMRR